MYYIYIQCECEPGLYLILRCYAATLLSCRGPPVTLLRCYAAIVSRPSVTLLRCYAAIVSRPSVALLRCYTTIWPLCPLRCYTATLLSGRSGHCAATLLRYYQAVVLIALLHCYATIWS